MQEILEQLLAEGKSTAEIAQQLQMGKSTVQARMRQYGLRSQFPTRRCGQTKYSAELLAPIVAAASSIRDVLRELGLTMTGGSHALIKRAIAKHGIDTSHFTPYSGVKTARTKAEYLLPENVFVKNPRASVSHVRRLARIHVTPYQCKKCENPGEWMGEPVTLQLDHINGDNSDQRIDNLRWLCPNCHSQTETWGFKSREKDGGSSPSQTVT